MIDSTYQDELYAGRKAFSHFLPLYKCQYPNYEGLQRSVERLPPPATLVAKHLWPKSFLLLSLVSIIAMPPTGLIAVYSALITRSAINKGQYTLAVERSENTKMIIGYTYVVGIVTMLTVALTLAVVWGVEKIT